MDETGFILGKTSSCKVLARQGRIKHDRRAREAGNRNFVTVCECVSASGRVLTPLVIRKGSSSVVSSVLLAANLSGKDKFVVGYPKGWTDSDIFGKWLREVFGPETRSGRRRLLLLDDHIAHVSLAPLQFAVGNGIWVVCLLSHTSYMLQPLDVSAFAPEGHWYNKEVARLSSAGLSNRPPPLHHHSGMAQSWD